MSKPFLSSSPTDIAKALHEQNRFLQEKEAEKLANQYKIKYLNLQNFPLDLNVLGMFSKEEALASESFPIYKEAKDMRIATLNPNNQLLQHKLEELSEHYKVELYFISQGSFDDTIKFYSKVTKPQAIFDKVVKVSEDLTFHEANRQLNDKKFQEEASASEIFMYMFGLALLLKASDIHIEPDETILKLRYRVDGVLQDLVHLPKLLQKKIISRLKLLSKLKLNVTNEAQDGRLSFYRGAEAIDIRVSILPSVYGESVVMRLLGVGAEDLDIVQLGLRKSAQDHVEQALHEPNGMIVTTGPTGSGKTTTLYSFLKELNKPGVKIITLEDPIEYKLAGIQQTPIDHNVDFNFAKGLRAVLRQDPDIVMVGEIRDQETADTALQAALTGHVVLSTLHTNDASGAVPRLMTMGIKPFVAAPALKVVIAQRLVRRLCQHCKKEAIVEQVLLEKVKKVLEALPASSGEQATYPLKFYSSPGCSECNGLGYKGRVGIYEVLPINEAQERLILDGAPSLEIRKQAVADGMVSLTQDGLLKATEGLTDIEEVFRVAGSG